MPASEFGDYTDSAEFNDEARANRDFSYVPGFSDMRRARDLKIAEYVNHKCSRSDIPELPVNCRWARNQNKAGEPDSFKPVSHSNIGYEIATVKRIGEPWLTSMPPGAKEGPGGQIMKGDTVLMVATKEAAAANARFKAQKTAKRVTGMADAFAVEAQKSGVQWKGADPTTKKENLSPIKVPATPGKGN